MKKTIRSLTFKHYAHFALGAFTFSSTLLSVLPDYVFTEMTALYFIITCYAWAAAARYEHKLNRAKAKAKEMRMYNI